MGDINCDLLSENNVNVNALLNVSDVYGLKQLITEPTRITHSSGSLNLVSFSGVSHVGISDHSLVYAFRRGFRANLNFRKFKVALNLHRRIF